MYPYVPLYLFSITRLQHTLILRLKKLNCYLTNAILKQKCPLQKLPPIISAYIYLEVISFASCIFLFLYLKLSVCNPLNNQMFYMDKHFLKKT